jgi:hypothetical protein
MKKWIAGAVLLSVFSGCRSKPRTDSETAFAVGSWWAESNSNLLLSIAREPRLSFCMESSGESAGGRFEKDFAAVSSNLRFALLEWFRAIKQTVTVQQVVADGCRPDVAKGIFKVVLHYDENAFQRNISQTTSPTLGVYLVGDGSLHLNMNGISNPRRDPTGGRKTILHELGHMFGLHHSTTRGAVMQANLSQASNELTSDDILGIEAVWNKVRTSVLKSPAARPAETQKPVVEKEVTILVSDSTSVALTFRYDSWFKTSTEQSASLPDTQKCPLQQGQRVRVKVLENGKLEAGHLKVQIEDELQGCSIGRTGNVGYVYKAHID